MSKFTRVVWLWGQYALADDQGNRYRDKTGSTIYWKSRADAQSAMEKMYGEKSAKRGGNDRSELDEN